MYRRMVIGPNRESNFEPASGVVRAKVTRPRACTAPCARSEGRDGRHQRTIPVGADALAGTRRPKSMPSVLSRKPWTKSLARLLAVADDVDPGIFLKLEGEEGGVALRLAERLARWAPGRPQHARLGQPGRLRQRAGDCRFEHGPPDHSSNAASNASRSASPAGARLEATPASSWLARRRNTIWANGASRSFCAKRVGVKPHLCAILE